MSSCALESYENNAVLAGTGAEVCRFILIEYPGVWPNKAIEGADLFSNALKTKLTSLENIKILLIRKEGKPLNTGRQIFFIESDVKNPKINNFRLQNYEDLLQLDFAQAFAGGDKGDHNFLLVCTHGTRDKCCGTYGGQTYKALKKHLPDWTVWQCSHVGGHRYAPCVLQPTAGLSYGFVFEQAVEKFAEELTQSRIPLKHLRGNMLLPKPAQAAEFALCEKLNAQDIGRFSLIQSSETEVQLVDMSTQQTYAIKLEKTLEGEDTLCSCSPEKRKATYVYKVQEIRDL